uniref:uS17 n=1 Tax=Paranosema locustae TaxID=235221 RepID=UPI00187D6E1F|nr:Chain SL0, uS17 [Paranosema locustae]
MGDILDKAKTYPKQKKPHLVSRREGKDIKPERYYKNIGMGYNVPETAINGTYIDKKCPFTGNVTIRGRIFKGEVFKMKQEKTIVVVKRYFHYNKKYKRYERRNTKFNVHLSPCFFGLVRVGDTVTCGETRALSKTKHFAVIDYKQKDSEDGQYAQFTGFS